MKDFWPWLVALGLNVLCCLFLCGSQHFFCLVKINRSYKLV